MKEMKHERSEPEKATCDSIELPFKEISALADARTEELPLDDGDDNNDGYADNGIHNSRNGDSDNADCDDYDSSGDGESNHTDGSMDDSNEDDDDRAYEARRAVRMERIRRRKQKRRRRRILIGTLSAAAVVIVCTAAYFGDELVVKLQAVQEQAAQMISKEKEEAAQPASEEETKQASSDSAENAGENNTAGQTDGQNEEENQEELSKEDKRIYLQAKHYAAQYDYDKAIELLKSSSTYDQNGRLQSAAAKYEKLKASCVSWPLEEVTHVFYHSLIVDTSKAFDGDYKTGDYNQVMTTIDEFNKITQTMYDEGYVMVSIYDIAKADENGNITRGEILLPPGKVPFVLSQDDLCYYHYMDGDGFASKLVVDDEGKVRNEYIEDDGSVSVGDYDMVPLIDRFVEEHPDFSYRGAKGIVALTGYNGILGYRTDISYETRPDDLDANKVEWLNAHPDFSLEEEREGAARVAQAMKDEGWLFASHTWGHKNIADVSMERLQTDTQNFKENVDPLIGGTDIIIFAFGTDLAQAEDYSGEKFEYLKGQGYNYYCNVDSRKYFVQIRDNYLRMGRRNLDGYRMYYHPELLEDLFTVSEVFDSARPVPVPSMG